MYNKKHSCFFPKSTTLIYFVRFLLWCIKIEKNRLAALERCLNVLDISEVDSESRLWILKNYILWNIWIWNLERWCYVSRRILRLARWINSKYIESEKTLIFIFLSFLYLIRNSLLILPPTFCELFRAAHKWLTRLWQTSIIDSKESAAFYELEQHAPPFFLWKEWK